MSETKVCRTCGAEKNTSDFPKNRNLFYPSCKSCHNKRSRDLRKQNPEIFRERERCYREKHPWKGSAKEAGAKSYCQSHREQMNEKKRLYIASHPEKFRAAHAKNVSRVVASYARQIMRWKNAPIEVVEAKRIQLKILRLIKEMTK